MGHRFILIAGFLLAVTLPAQAESEAVGNVFQSLELSTQVDETAAAMRVEPSTETSDLESGSVVRDTGSPLTPDFINFAWLQSNTVLPYLHWESLTHVATTFLGFNSTGNFSQGTRDAFTGRNAHLRAGGSADRAGTKVIMCVINGGFETTTLETVMASPTYRTNLVNEIVNLITNDGYCQGVNFDFEPNWNSTTRNNITLFLQQMRAALPPPYEISVYVHPTYNSTYWGNMPNIIGYLDYVLYSTYDYGTSVPHANSDFDSCMVQVKNYMDNGVPPEKMVLTWASYGRRWESVSAYNQNTDTDRQSQGFYDGLFNTTLRQANGGPFPTNYVRGDEIGWHTYNVGSTPHTVVHETPESLEMKISAALSAPLPSGNYRGVRLRGVGWWSLMWMSNYFHSYDINSIGNNFRSFDPVTNQLVSRPPHYRHPYLLVQEILKTPSNDKLPLESFEGDNPHWRDPHESPDTTGDTDDNSSYASVTAPAGANRPTGTTRAGRLTFDFEAASGNKAFLRYELLNHPIENSITDTNAALGLVWKNTRIEGHYYVPSNYSSRNLRLALVDGQREIEVSDPIQLPSTAGWYTFQWDLNDPEQINSWNTNEPTLLNGDGVVDTASADARDISFLGFIVEGGGAGTGNIYFDELMYQKMSVADKVYAINEFRYSNSTSEFVEIAGPPGPFPADMTLITYNSSNGAAYKTVSLAGRSIPASGLFVVGDAGVAGASGISGFTPANWTGDDIPNNAPGALQLYGSSSGSVYDSVVYAAYGGLADLPRVQTRGVIREGYGWMGNVGPGASVNGEPYTMGRLSDGDDTNHNQSDFSFMPATPGQPNGATGLLNTVFDFTTMPSAAFQTYQSPTVASPVAAGIPASPGGGNAYRCVDTSGGGVIGVFGDAQMGATTGLDISGRLYIPAGIHPAQAVAVGFCGTKGSTFFSASPQGSGYEDGYWLVYEHGTNDLNNGQPNHAQQFKFYHATNDNMDSIISSGLGTQKNLTQVGASAGTWATFRLQIDPTASPTEQLLAQINGADVYRGAIPNGGPTAGAFMVGFREAMGGTMQAYEGTWIDDLQIKPANAAAGVPDYELY